MKIPISAVATGFILLFMSAGISDARAEVGITAKSLFEKISKEQNDLEDKTSKSLNKAQNDRKKLCKLLGSDLSLQTQLKEYVGSKNLVNPLKLSIVDVRLANSASAAINKWLKPRVPDGCVVHSFRHSLRDRLRAVQCPSDMIDQIGGWATAGIGQAYGEGYSIKIMHKCLQKIT